MNLTEALKEYFGYGEFRFGQEEVIRGIIEGKDTLVVMPTGGGKSICYQLPALMMDGITIVVSPLISLMQDQVDALKKRNIPCTYINSTLSRDEFYERLDNLEAYKIIYVAPERFRDPRFIEAVKRTKISLFAVDEAHCISQWGHDFRPDYMRLNQAITNLGRPTVAGFTATATPFVQEDIITQLTLKEPKRYVSGFSRENLSLNVVPINKMSDKFRHLELLIEKEKVGIVYCATRKRVDAVYEKLRSWDCSVAEYHAGMTEKQRTKAQDRFIEKRVDIVVATNAFGMGIDRDDLRFIAHFELPGSVEAYYQEVGRAGRDGKPATCELYYSFADKRIQEFFIEGSNPSKAVIQQVYGYIRSFSDNGNQVHITIDDLSEQMGRKVNSMAVGTALGVLVRAGVIDRVDVAGSPIKMTRLLKPDLTPFELPIDYGILEAKAERDYGKLENVIQFSSGRGCRQNWILNYFGESGEEKCGKCDRCSTLLDTDGIRALTDEENVVVRKALSGIARMSWRQANGDWMARFGKKKIMMVLQGKKRKELEAARLMELSTYGILSDIDDGYLEKLFNELERVEAIRTTFSNKMPVMTLTGFGEKLMRGTVEIEMALPEAAGGESPKKSQWKKREVTVSGDPVLLQKLKDKRAEIARKKRNARVFMILPNGTLEQLAALMPSTIEEAQGIKGIGPVKARTVLPEFLEVIKSHQA